MCSDIRAAADAEDLPVITLLSAESVNMQAPLRQKATGRPGHCVLWDYLFSDTAFCHGAWTELDSRGGGGGEGGGRFSRFGMRVIIISSENVIAE